MVRNYQNADFSLKKNKFIVLCIIIFSTFSFPIVWKQTSVSWLTKNHEEWKKTAARKNNTWHKWNSIKRQYHNSKITLCFSIQQKPTARGAEVHYPKMNKHLKNIQYIQSLTSVVWKLTDYSSNRVFSTVKHQQQTNSLNQNQIFKSTTTNKILIVQLQRFICSTGNQILESNAIKDRNAALFTDFFA